MIKSVYAPVFFAKLASDYGIVPQTEAECQELLEAAAMLRPYDDQAQQEKKASASSLVSEAVDGLKSALSGQGRQTPPSTYQRLTKNAAAELAENPVIQEAALALGQFMLANAE
jgi:hypothetical protein